MEMKTENERRKYKLMRKLKMEIVTVKVYRDKVLKNFVILLALRIL